MANIHYAVVNYQVTVLWAIVAIINDHVAVLWPIVANLYYAVINDRG